VTNPTVFSDASGKLADGNSTEFYASEVPSGTVQQAIYTSEKPVRLEISWKAI
jgi:hypothetical protein